MKKCLPLFSIILFSFLLVGCSSTSEEGSGTVFYDAVQQVAPSFDPASASVSKIKSEGSEVLPVTTAWESGNPLYEIFYILREFNPDTDQGVIDTSNLYKTMWESRNFFSNTKGNCTAITEQVIAPPFDFGNAATTYNCAYNEEASDGYDFGGAYKELDENGAVVAVTEESKASTTATVKHGLFSFVWADPDHNEYGTVQGVFNSSTNELALDIAVWVDYDGENDYCYRNDIEGNAETHAFTFRSIKGNKAPGSSYTSIVGKGYSQGEGKYFLLKVTNNDLTGKYYCIGAEDGETELQAMNAESPEGSSTVDANCEEYEEDVYAMAAFTTDDLACGSSDFNPGGTGTAAEGTIFLNFE